MKARKIKRKLDRIRTELRLFWVRSGVTIRVVDLSRVVPNTPYTFSQVVIGRSK